MGRTNIDIDDDLIATVMARYELPTKREAVDFVLRRLAAPKMSRRDMLDLEGTGWDNDLDELTRDTVPPL